MFNVLLGEKPERIRRRRRKKNHLVDGVMVVFIFDIVGFDCATLTGCRDFLNADEAPVTTSTNFLEMSGYTHIHIHIETLGGRGSKRKRRTE